MVEKLSIKRKTQINQSINQLKKKGSVPLRPGEKSENSKIKILFIVCHNVSLNVLALI